MDPRALVPLFMGLLCIIGAVQNGDWFMYNQSSRIWVESFGRKKVRIAFVLIGLAFIAAAALLTP